MMTKNFKDSEFYCKCGTCENKPVQPLFLSMLQNARDIANIPFIINSGYRCPVHNKRVGGAEWSEHLKANAVDIRITNSRERYIILNALITAGFSRIGLAKNFIHVDNSSIKPKNVFWIY